MLPIPVAFGGAVSVSGFQIGLYDSCRRRFFYTHVVEIGGRRTATPYLLMHDAVRSVAKEIVSHVPSEPARSEVEP